MTQQVFKTRKRRETAPEWAWDHFPEGMSKTKTHHPLYMHWWGMRYRCYGPKIPSNKSYQERGISVCDQWREDFWQFVKDMGMKPTPEHELDRIDNDGNYEPSNCRWATRKEQQFNRRCTIRVEVDEEKLPLVKLAEKYGMPYRTVANRLRLGWELNDALTRPVEDRAIPETDRRAICRKMYEDGKTLEEIGTHFGLTKERARQLMSTPSQPKSHTCRMCGKTIMSFSKRAYCGPECKAKANPRMKKCQGCGKLFEVAQGRRYCSDVCRPDYLAYETVLRRSILSRLRRLPIKQLQDIYEKVVGAA